MLSSKTRPPRSRVGMVARSRLLESLGAEQAPLVVVTGPAGSGKTVLVLQWLGTRGPADGTPVAWLTVDPRDNDPVRLWPYLGAALAGARPELDWTPAPGDDPVEHLQERLAAAAPLLLVLDDVHFLVEGPVLDPLARLVDGLPAGVQVVLVSRTLPQQLHLARQRVHGRLREIAGSELMFTTEETATVLGRAASDPVTSSVQHSTGGWPVAVGFAARLPSDGARVPFAGHARQHLTDYLTEEVLRAEPADVQDFLLDTCVLDEVTAVAANAVRDARDAAQHLAHLERDEVFLTPLAGSGEDVWRHHALVRDHLRTTLQRTRPDRWTRLHGRAAAFYATRDLDRAIGHALAAPDPGLAADLLTAEAADPARLFERYGMGQVVRWLAAMPDEVVGGRDALRALGVGAAATLIEEDLVRRWLATRPADAEPGVEELFAEAWYADAAGDKRRQADACRRALALVDPGSHWWRTLHGGLAGPAFVLGDWQQAAESFHVLLRPVREAMELADPADRATVGLLQETARAQEAVALVRSGAGERAGAALAGLHAWLTEVEPLGYRSCGAAAWARGATAFDRGDLDTARRWTALPDADAYPAESLIPLLMRLDLARVRRAVGDGHRARELVADVRRGLPVFADPGLLPEWVAEEEAALGVRVPGPPTGPAAAAGPAGVVEALSARELEVLRLLRSEYSLPEIASHLYVSYNTVKTHTRTIYRKLGATSRSGAVARARRAGLI